MLFYTSTQRDLLQIGDDFASLLSIQKNGDPKFRFFYSISPSDAIKNNATLVLVTISLRNVKQNSLISENNGIIDAAAFIRNIVSQTIDIKNNVKQHEAEYVLARYRSDISSKINNEIAGQLAAGVNKTKLQQRNKSVLKLINISDLQANNESRPLLNISAHHTLNDLHTVYSSSIDTNPTTLMFDMITRQGLDPSCVVNTLTHRSVPAQDSIQGTLRKAKSQEYDNTIATRLLNYFLYPSETHHLTNVTSGQPGSNVVPVLVSEPQEKIEVVLDGVIPISFLKRDRLYHDKGGTNFNIKFDLVNSKTLQIVSSVTKQLDVATHIQVHYIPTIAPIVSVTRSEISSRANLKITQLDPGATGVKVYKKIVSRATVDAEDYLYVGSFNVKQNQQPLLVQVDLPRSSAAIYRVIPIGELGTIGTEYTNVVIKPAHYAQIKSVALSTSPLPIGIELNARHIPQNVVSMAFKVRNMTTHESNYRVVGDDVLVLTDEQRIADHVTIIDINTQPNNIYEYVVELIYKSGTSEVSGNAVVETIRSEPGKVDTKITDVVVDSSGDEPNVTFTITTDLIDSNHDVIKSLLQRQDIYDLFKKEVTDEREFLKKLIAHNVQRVNLTTGTRENFGTLTTTTFSDKDFRKNQAIKSLVYGHHYTYEVQPLLRSPETMFSSYLKTSIDSLTNKQFTWSPSKYLHPITLTRGVIVSRDGLSTRFAKDDMSHGAIGAVQLVNITFDNEPINIYDQTVSRFDRDRNVITWKIKGQVHDIDHFILMKDVLGVRTMIGKLHTEFINGNCRFIHKLSSRDFGVYQYVIVPVFNNYQVGTSVKTNYVIIEDNNGV